MRECENIQRQLALYVRGELNESQCRDIETHLVSCTACRAEADALQRLGALLDKTLQGEQIDVKEKVVSRLKKEGSKMERAYPITGKRKQIAISWRLLRAAALAAAVLIAIVSIWHYLQQLPQTPEPQPRNLAILGKVEAAEAVKTRIVKFYEPVKVDIKPQIPQYELPVDLEKVFNMERFAKYSLSDKAKGLLRKNGFVVLPPTKRTEHITGFYTNLKVKNIPLLITTDALLHLYHIQFDTTLERIEQQEFYRDTCLLSEALFNHFAQKAREFDSELKEAARRNAAFFAVARLLLEGKPLIEHVDTAAIKRAIKEHGSRVDEQVHKMQYKLLLLPPGFITDDERGKLQKMEPKWGKDLPDVVAIYEKVYKRLSENAQKVYQEMLAALPAHLVDAVNKELRQIEEHLGASSPLFSYEEDYSLYVPRGHYTRSSALKIYFKAMTWFGRVAFLIKGGTPCGRAEPYLVPPHIAKTQTLQACLISKALDVKASDGRTVLEIWDRIYSVTAYYVGVADDLTPYEYRAAMDAVLGKEAKDKDLLDAGKFSQLRRALAALRSPEIYGGTGAQVGPHVEIATAADLDRVLDKTKGMRLMGQRYVPDSYIMGQLGYPTVGAYIGDRTPRPFTFVASAGGPIRALPRGLDVMAALGSERALDILKSEGDTDYEGYFQREDPKTGKLTGLTPLRAQFAKLTEKDFNRNLYWSWLWMLKSLLKKPRDYEGYQRFQQTESWVDKQLNAALGSWAQLRHDTILYTKYFGHMFTAELIKPKPVAGYVEPEPEFFARLLALTRMTLKGLDDMKVLSDAGKKRLQRFEKLIKRIFDILIKEIKNEELNEDDDKFLRGFSATLSSIVGAELVPMKTTMIADVCSDINSGMCLEEGTGYLRTMIVICKLPNGALQAFAGPAFSYYEFKQPVSNRLTDEEWRQMLGSADAPALPEWTTSFSPK